ncbi:NAD(P)-binding protein [Meredithblackwellia eburnea MCA 4105]
MQGKRALVTGGSAGLGAAIVQKLAKEGVICAVNYANDSVRAEKLVASLEGKGHVSVKGSPFTKEGATNVVHDAIKALSGLDFIVSNAGATKFGNFTDLNSVDEAGWDLCYNANVKSHLWMMQAGQEELKKNKGAFLITASTAGLKPSGSSMAYAVSKAGTIHLCKSLAKACAPDIRVNAVAPGLLMTDWSKDFSEAQVQMSKEASVLKRLAEVNDVADTFVMLVKNQSITGQIVECSAGFGM